MSDNESGYEKLRKRPHLPFLVSENTELRNTRPMPDELPESAQRYFQKFERIKIHRDYTEAQERTGNAALNKLLYDQKQEAKRKAKDLSRELDVMRQFEPSTIDGEYSARFNAEQSGIAAGPRGAASGGLRPLGILEFFTILDKRFDEKLEQARQNKKVNDAIRAAGKVKLVSNFRYGANLGGSEHYSAKLIHKIDASMTQIQKDEQMQLREELKAQREMSRMISTFLKEQRARNPVKKKDLPDQIPPMHGPGFNGWGSIA